MRLRDMCVRVCECVCMCVCPSHPTRCSMCVCVCMRVCAPLTQHVVAVCVCACPLTRHVVAVCVCVCVCAPLTRHVVADLLDEVRGARVPQHVLVTHGDGGERQRWRHRDVELKRDAARPQRGVEM